MNEPHYYCPACHRKAKFITNERRQRRACALCYTEFPLDWVFATEGRPPAASPAQTTFNLLGLVLLVVLGAPAMLLAILFIGCVAL